MPEKQNRSLPTQACDNNMAVDNQTVQWQWNIPIKLMFHFCDKATSEKFGSRQKSSACASNRREKCYIYKRYVRYSLGKIWQKGRYPDQAFKPCSFNWDMLQDANKSHHEYLARVSKVYMLVIVRWVNKLVSEYVGMWMTEWMNEYMSEWINQVLSR